MFACIVSSCLGQPKGDFLAMSFGNLIPHVRGRLYSGLSGTRILVHRFARWWRPEDYVRVVIYGSHSEDWMTALGPGAEAWAGVPGVYEVLQVAEGLAGSIPRETRHRTVVIPLMEPHIALCPAGYSRLIPTEQALRTLQDKGAFAAYARSCGLAALCPETYTGPGQAVYPCVLKRLDLNNCDGVRVVTSEEECRECLEQEPWRGRAYLLQEYVASDDDRCTHCVCVDGQIVWHCSYVYSPAPKNIQERYAQILQRVTEPASCMADFQALLAPLRFSGPCNIDYRIRAKGRVAVLEINPRLGGSLMRPVNRDDLKAALATIVQHARSGGAL